MNNEALNLSYHLSQISVLIKAVYMQEKIDNGGLCSAEEIADLQKLENNFSAIRAIMSGQFTLEKSKFFNGLPCFRSVDGHEEYVYIHSIELN